MTDLSRRAFLGFRRRPSPARWWCSACPPAPQTPKESPALQAKVDAGELPPITERLPENPLVITPIERPGQQGGDWNHALVGGGSLSMVLRYQAYEPLVRYTPDWSGVEPNVAESYEVERRRQGLHVQAAQGHEVVGRRALHHRGRAASGTRTSSSTPTCRSRPARATGRSGGEKGKLEVIDEQTFKVTFSSLTVSSC